MSFKNFKTNRDGSKSKFSDSGFRKPVVRKPVVRKPVVWSTEKVERYFLWLLQRKEYSEKELFNKAKIKQIPMEMYQFVLEKMQRLDFQNNERYTETIVRSKSNQWGPQRIKWALHQKGLVLENQLDEVDWPSKAEKILRSKVKGPIDRAAQQKLLRWAMGRGFSYEVAKNALESVMSERLEELD